MALQQAQKEEYSISLDVYQLKILQEQDFGSFEKMTFAARAKAIEGNIGALKQPETKEAMSIRANHFLDDCFLPLLFSESTDDFIQVAIVSHGLMLSTLWRCLLKRFITSNVKVAFGVELPEKDMLSLEHIGAWTNTGFLELSIESIDSGPDSESGTLTRQSSEVLAGYRMIITAVNNTEHLRGLKRTGGGVGSSKHDEKQKSIESFFKKQKTA